VTPKNIINKLVVGGYKLIYLNKRRTLKKKKQWDEWNDLYHSRTSKS
jgi:hypothetical protein